MRPMIRRILGSCVAFLLCTVSLFAQTIGTGAIVGRALDPTGAVIPGVEVTITSPQLIGGAHTTVTDELGVYRFELLRAGTYRVSFALPGFKTINIDDVGVVVNVTKTQDATMEVSATAEEVTVSSQAPTIDLEAATIGVNWSQKMIDDLPWSRSLVAISAMIPNALATSYDVGNSSFGTSSSITARNGGLSGSNMVSMDGLYWCQTYEDYGTYEEMNVSTNAKGAEQLNAGITLALTVKSGSNNFHGNLSTGYQNGSMQSDNVTADLLAKGYSPGSSKYTHFTDYYGDIGGPIMRDKLWFYGAYRNGYQGTFTPGFVSQVGGTPAVFYTNLVSPTIKLSYQLSQKQKIDAYWALPDKEQPYRNGSALVPGDATYHQLAYYGQGPNIIYTNIIDSKTTFTAKLTHAGLWQDYAAHSFGSGAPTLMLGLTGVPGKTSQLMPTAPFEGMDPGSHQMSVLNNVGVHVSDTTTGAVDGAYTTNYTRQIRWQWNFDVSHVATIAGRANEIKVGYMGWWDEGNHLINYGYPYQEAYVYKSLSSDTCPGNSICSNYFLRPNSVVVTNLPNITATGGKYAGTYIDDKITVNHRLTLNVGMRWDHSSSFLPAQGNTGSGPFGTVQTIPYSTSVTNPSNYIAGMGGDVAKFPIYNLFTPRLSVAYDVMGDGKLALKGSYGRYSTISSSPGASIGPVGASTSGVNPIGSQSCTFNNWNGVIPFVPTFGAQNYLGSPTNANLASACPPAQTVNGLAVEKGIVEFDPNLRSSYVTEFTGGVEVGFSKNYSLRATVSRKFAEGGVVSGLPTATGSTTGINPLLPASAYTDVVCGTDPITHLQNVCAYTVPTSNPNRLVSYTLYKNYDLKTHEGQSSYTAYDVTFNKQYANRWSFLTGFGLYLVHPNTANPMFPTQVLTNSQNDLASWTPSFKMNGAYELPAIPAFLPGALHKGFGGFVWSGTFTSQKGDWYGRSAQVKDLLGTTETILMDGHYGRYPAVTDWDNRITKRIRFGEKGRSLELKWDLYNSLNASTVTAFKSTNSSASTFLVPSTILPGRIYQWGASFKF